MVALPFPDPVRIVWTHKADEALSCAVLTSDGQHIVAGSQKGKVYFLNRAGKLLWQQKVEKEIFRLALAENRRCVLVGCAGSVSTNVWRAYLFSYEGVLVRTFDVDGETLGVGITPNADLIALGTFHNSLYLFDGDGQQLWHQRLGGPVRQLSLTPDGRYIAVGGDDQQAYMFDQTGKERWRFPTKGSIFTGAHTDATATSTVIGSNDRNIYLLDRTGQRLWHHPTGGNVNVVVITPDGWYIAGAGNARKVFFFSRSGEVLWSYPTNANIYDLGLTHDGEFVVVGTSDYQLSLLNKQGHCLWQYQTGDRMRLSITPNGRLFVTASRDHSLILYENLHASDDFSSQWTTNLLVRRVRHAYMHNPYQGISSWFDEFDRVLGQRTFPICEALLREIRTEGYLLQAGERDYVDSREAALLLCQGICFHQRQEYAAARQCYLHCLDIQQRIHHGAGESQVEVALAELAKQAQSDAAVLRILLSAPHVLGNGSEVVAARLAGEASLVKRQQLILAAKEAGYFLPLTQELASSVPATQTCAALALSWLRPGPDYDQLLSMLASPNWFVRWQAILLLDYKLTEKQGDAALYNNKVRQAVALCLKDGEQDPTVRRAAAELLGKVGDASTTLALLPLLQDQDTGVRFATAEALGQTGTREALPALRHVRDGMELHGESIKAKVKEALDLIENRYPIFEVKSITFCRELGGRNTPLRPGTIFLALAGTMYCIATVSLTQPGQQVTCAWYEKGRLLEEQVQRLTEQSSSPEVPLVELLDNEDVKPARADEQADQPHLRRIVFAYTPKKGRWSPGNYFVRVRLEKEPPRQELFSIIDQIAIDQAQTCLDLDGNGRFLLPLQVFPAAIPFIHCQVFLKEAPIDAEVEGKVYCLDTNTRIESATIKAKVAGEGSNAQVVLKYASSAWKVGNYSIVLETSTKSRKNCNFSIIRPQDFFDGL